MVVETERLHLRRFAPEDSAALYGFLGDAELLKYEPYAAFSHDECVREAGMRAGNEAFWAVCLKAENTLIGSLTLLKQRYATWEIGFVFRRDMHGNGYAAEAASAMIDRAFRVWQAHRIIAMCNPDNTPSLRLLQRLGLRNEGRLRSNVWLESAEAGDNKWRDTLLYALLRDEWEQKQAALH